MTNRTIIGYTSAASLLRLITGSQLASQPAIVAFVYLAGITAAEFTVLFNAQLGLTLHALVLSGLIFQAAFIASEATRRLLLALSLAPLIRILSMSIPLQAVELTYWYAIVAVPLFVASFVIARTLGLTRRDLGLTLGFLPVQLLVACTGIILGTIEFFILDPEPLIDSFSWRAILLPALILLLGTGFMEELVFRGVMQAAAREALGRGVIVYVSGLFAVLHLGYESALEVLVVFLIALYFGLVVTRTRSILGVTLAHGLTNTSLFLLVPFIL